MANALPLKTNLFPLGILKPGAAGSSVQLTSNFADLGSSQQQFAVLYVRAHPSNGSFVFVLNNGSAADTTSFQNVLDVLVPGEEFIMNLVPSQVILPGQYFIDVSKTGDLAVAMVTQI